MTAWLQTQGHAANRKRVRRLIQRMGLAAIYQPNRIYVADQVNNRVLGWHNTDSFENGARADLVIGQPGFLSRRFNNGGASAMSLYTGWRSGRLGGQSVRGRLGKQPGSGVPQSLHQGYEGRPGSWSGWKLCFGELQQGCGERRQPVWSLGRSAGLLGSPVRGRFGQ
jgi:hypothetical protein